MSGWNHKTANVLRNLAAALVLVAERFDPQPPVEMSHPFTVTTTTGTVKGEHKWHWVG